jgi:hypothetical protein
VLEKTREKGLSGCSPAGHTYFTVGALYIYYDVVKINFSKNPKYLRITEKIV